MMSESPATHVVEAQAGAQGGVAIAAHPYEPFWPAYDAEALRKLDGAEVVRPEAQTDEALASQLRDFYGREADGDRRIGLSRPRPGGVFPHLRFRSRQNGARDPGCRPERRTIVYDRGRAYGDPALIELVAKDGWLGTVVPDLPAPGSARLFSRIAAVLGLVAALLFNKW